MTHATLVVELLTEELPPKALERLGAAFAKGVADGLRSRGLLLESSIARTFATPRRLGVSITEVLATAPDRPFEERLMPVSVGLDAAGHATPALQKKLAKAQLAHLKAGDLERVNDGKTEQLVYRGIARGQPLGVALQGALEESIAGLPIPKVMSYQLADGVTTVQFVRPAHGLVALHGPEVVPVSALGLCAGRTTRGHRFQGAKALAIPAAAEYETKLEAEGGVIADFTVRRAQVLSQLLEKAKALGAGLGPREGYEALLDEVTALVEMPTVYAGAFEPEFLAVPAECLVLTMRQNQKYFPLFDAAGALTNRFLIVSNMRLADPANIVRGNERVVRPRLADARFFYETDRRTKLADRVAQLGAIVYQGKLGTQLERVERLRRLATRMQAMLPRGAVGMPYADRAALLAKADLVTLMVGEFPELQGIMGKYYAESDGEEPSVVRAIEQHYWPRFAGDQLPDGDVSIALALADRLDALAGMFGIGQVPSGDKDPLGLRRAALGVIRILIERQVRIPLPKLVDWAFEGLAGKCGDAHAELEAFIRERMTGYFRDQGFTAQQVDAVLSPPPPMLLNVPGCLRAVREFEGLPEAASLAAANKRVVNILRKAEQAGEAFAGTSAEGLVEAPERSLYQALNAIAPVAERLFAAGDFTGYLKSFAVLKEPVDHFFEKVMVMADDAALRRNRLALLRDLREAMNRVADISRLAA